jgi:hypothetical protein
MTELTNNDYTKILKFYKKSIPKTSRLLKLQAESILANKLCRCIKKVDKKNESRSIGICTKTIINNKGYTRGKFKCRRKTNIKFKKNTNNKTKRKKLF